MTVFEGEQRRTREKDRDRDIKERIAGREEKRGEREGISVFSIENISRLRTGLFTYMAFGCLVRLPAILRSARRKAQDSNITILTITPSYQILRRHKSQNYGMETLTPYTRVHSGFLPQTMLCKSNYSVHILIRRRSCGLWI